LAISLAATNDVLSSDKVFIAFILPNPIYVNR